MSALKTPPDKPQPCETLPWISRWDRSPPGYIRDPPEDLTPAPVSTASKVLSRSSLCRPLIRAAWINDSEMLRYEHLQHHSIVPICHESIG